MRQQDYINFVKFLFNRFARIVIIVAIYAIAVLVALRQPAKSQVIDSEFYQLTVYEIQENELEEKQCYIVSNPIKSDSDHGSRKKPYVMITRFQKSRTEEISVSSGYEYKLNSEIFILLDDKQFKLLTKNNIAWAKTKYDDVRIIQTMLNSGVLRVRSDSSVGTFAVDEYSLQGITRAYARMREVCR